MKYDGMTGSATESNHPEWIACNSLSFAAFRDADTKPGHGGNRQSKPVSIGDVTLTMPLSAASPDLFKASLNAEGKKVLIHVTPGGLGKAHNCLEMTLENCMVSNYTVNTNGVAHTETVYLNFLNLEMKYIPISEDGSPGTPVPVKFKIPTGETG
jgi:type VI secretion system secreted protein Hcp